MASKLVPKLVHLWIPFLCCFGAPFAALGSSLGAHDSLLGSLWTSKTLKNCRFFKVFENVASLLFEALDGTLGLVLPVLWADLAPKWAPKWLQNGPKMASKMGPKKALKNEPKMDSKMAHRGCR